PAGFPGQGTGLIDTYGPQPFVDSQIVSHNALFLPVKDFNGDAMEVKLLTHTVFHKSFVRIRYILRHITEKYKCRVCQLELRDVFDFYKFSFYSRRRRFSDNRKHDIHQLAGGNVLA